MSAFEEFEQHLRHSLTHLYDPTFQPHQLLWEVTGIEPKQGIQPLQAKFIQEIENLKPSPHVPPNARIRLVYEVLSCRYLQNLTQEEAAKCVGITSRTLRRIQQQAIHLLAQRLWEKRPQEPSARYEIPSSDKIRPTETNEESTWRAQLKEELAFLQESAPGLVVNVGEIIKGAVEMGRALTSKHGVGLSLTLPETPLTTTVHASILRQILIRAFGKLVQYMDVGEMITVSAQEQGEYVYITINGYPTSAEEMPHSDFIQEALATQGGSFDVRREAEQIIFQIMIPSASRITILVVDDNTDLVHFYRRYVAGTRYEIVHLAEGQRLFESIADLSPDIIVLDVMLPGIDGWELLTHLHEYPDTRAIPVIVCSVVRGEEMALALGAALYLQKPVRSRQFVEALDQVLSQAQREASKAEANTASPG
ncbi:MAG: response regulator [Anaerolineae bacterium]|nr:response regulator [Anaerolineae bacterium]